MRQWFQSPTTDTRRALGAHTANVDAGLAVPVVHVSAEDLPEPPVVALADEVEIDVAEQGPRAEPDTRPTLGPGAAPWIGGAEWPGRSRAQA